MKKILIWVFIGSVVAFTAYGACLPCKVKMPATVIN